MINLNVEKIHSTPMRLVLSNGGLLGCIWYGDKFYNKDNFTPEMKEIYEKWIEVGQGNRNNTMDMCAYSHSVSDSKRL